MLRSDNRSIALHARAASKFISNPSDPVAVVVSASRQFRARRRRRLHPPGHVPRALRLQQQTLPHDPLRDAQHHGVLPSLPALHTHQDPGLPHIGMTSAVGAAVGPPARRPLPAVITGSRPLLAAAGAAPWLDTTGRRPWCTVPAAWGGESSGETRPARRPRKPPRPRRAAPLPPKCAGPGNTARESLRVRKSPSHRRFPESPAFRRPALRRAGRADGRPARMGRGPRKAIWFWVRSLFCTGW